MNRKTTRTLVLVGPTLLAFVALALATVAPFGSHHGSRGADSGFRSGSVSPTGGYSTSVPMSLPPARGSLPVPASVTYTGGGRVGDAGVGWTIPFSYVSVGSSFSYRRPSYSATPALPQPPLERVDLVIDGVSDIMVRDPGVAGAYRPIFDDLETVLRRQADGSWQLDDGSGRHFHFVHIQDLTDADDVLGTDDDPETRMSLWLLQSIFDRTGQNKVELAYDVQRVPLPDGTNGIEVLLSEVRYNFHQTSFCPKHLVRLSYMEWQAGGGGELPIPGPGDESPGLSTGADSVLGYSLQNGELRVHTQILDTIDVLAVEGDHCPSEPVRVQRYDFSYSADADNGHPRLVSADMLGREGFPEETTRMPVARYEYGALTEDAGGVVPDPGEPAVPGGGAADEVAYSASASIAEPPGAALGHTLEAVVDGFEHAAHTRRLLRDFTGDGLPDLVYKSGADEKTMIAVNVTDFSKTSFSATAAQPLFPGLAVEDEPPVTQMTAADRRRQPGDWDPARGPGNLNEVWVDTIDFNGDGRLDILDARHDEKWVLHLNTPGVGTDVVQWRTVDLPIDHLIEALAPTLGNRICLPGEPSLSWFGSSFLGIVFGDECPTPRRLPLELSVTGPDWAFFRKCRAIDDVGDDDGDGFGTPTWVELDPAFDETCDPLGVLWDNYTPTSSWRTYVAWRLEDVNGDSYPDIVANANGVGAQEVDSCEFQDEWEVRVDQIGDRFPCGDHRHFGVLTGEDPTGAGNNYFEEPSGNELIVFYNVQGVRLRDGSPFAEQVVVGGAASGCALEQWDGQAETSSMRCGLVEMNGDGLPDRVIGLTAALGTGERFVGEIGIPVSPSSQSNDRSDRCSPTYPGFHDPAHKFESRRDTTVLDLTGDGIPDFFDAKNDRLYIGTGAGWSIDPLVGVLPPPVKLDLPSLITSERCFDFESSVTSGLFDVNGDGRFDYLESDGSALSVHEIVGAAGDVAAYSAGKLTRNHSGFGATLQIKYESAKKDTATQHRVPFPEIVVSETFVDAARSPGMPGDRLMYSYFGYGSASLHFNPLADRWMFPGYERRIEIEAVPGTVHGGHGLKGSAVVTDSIPFEELLGGGDREERYRRYALAGRPSNVYFLDGIFSNNPFEELAAVLPADPRTHGGTTMSYAMQNNPVLPVPDDISFVDCTDLSDPYDFNSSIATGSVFDPLCTRAGLAYVEETTGWRGDDPPEVSARNIQVRMAVVEVDDFGRPLLILHENDFARFDDDLCEILSYAEPEGSGSSTSRDAVHVRRLAVPSRGGSTAPGPADCTQPAKLVFGARYRYDNLPEGQVNSGLPTQVIVERYDVSTGDLIEEYLATEVEYNAVGNVRRVTSFGGDTQSRTTEFDYPADTFGLAARASTTVASSVGVALTSSVVLDPVTLAPLSRTDENGLTTGRLYDGFGRGLATWVDVPSSGERLVLESVEHEDIPSASMILRRITRRSYLDGLPIDDYLASVPDPSGTALESVTELDSLARVLHTDLKLGADYEDAVVRSNEAVYDAFGRVKFTVDAHRLVDADESVPYGTTFFYRDDGELECAIRGRGVQSAGPVTIPDEARFATCSETTFEGAQRVSRIRGPNELYAGSDHFGAYDQVVESAMGWVLARSRVHDGVRVEHSTHGFDALGRLTDLRRYEDAAALSNPVDWNTTYDSLGRVLTYAEPAVATRNFEYDWWGNRTRVSWTDGADIRVLGARFDGLGRVVEEIDATGDEADPASAINEAVCHTYDVASGSSDQLFPEFLVGRLSHSLRVQGGHCDGDPSRPTYDIYYGYDELGRTRAISRVGEDDRRYSQVSDFHIDGRLEKLTLFSFDNGYVPESVLYAYDSARRVTGISWLDGAGAEDVLTVPADGIDVFGRYRHLVFGNGVEEFYAYRDGDRRELLARLALTASGPHGTAYTEYDGELRVSQRFDLRPGGAGWWSDFEYDARYRLQSETRMPISLPDVAVEQFRYDGLGNVREITKGSSSVVLTPHNVDHDRICRVARGIAPVVPIGDIVFRSDSSGLLEGAIGGDLAPSLGPPTRVGPPDHVKLPPFAGPPADIGPPVVVGPPIGEVGPSDGCQYRYDALGNVSRIAGAGGARTFTYDGRSRIVEANNGTARATFAYDPTGLVSGLDVTGAGEHDRQDRRYGSLVETSTYPAEALSGTALERRVPGPPGIVMVRRTSETGETLLYLHSDSRGHQFTTDVDGNIVQDIDYRPFGGILDDTGSPGTLEYTKYQFNQGDALAAFGVSQIGARLQDSTTGRFLQRDPLVVPRTASSTHPYAFSRNDPINAVDPLGLDPMCDAYAPQCGGSVEQWFRFHLPVDRRAGRTRLESLQRYLVFKRNQAEMWGRVRALAELMQREGQGDAFVPSHVPRTRFETVNKIFEVACSTSWSCVQQQKDIATAQIQELHRFVENAVLFGPGRFESGNRFEPGEGLSRSDRFDQLAEPNIIIEVGGPVANAANWLWVGGAVIKLGRSAISYGISRFAAKEAGEIGTRSLVLMSDELLLQSIVKGPEVVSGFRIFGNKGLVGNVFQRNVLLIEAERKGATSLGSLVRSFEAEARAAGASRLTITGHAVINPGFTSAIANRYGFAFRWINKETFEITKAIGL